MTNDKNISLLKEMAEKVRICMFTTINPNGHFHSRPMATAEIDTDGSIWFFTNEHSAKSNDVSKDNDVNLTYSDPGNNTYLYINGKAKLADDKALKKKYFNPFVKAWFPKGIDDPDLTLLKITPVMGEYWDSSSSKMVVAFNTLKAIVTGKQYDEGKHGKIEF